jgi:uncharacterized lipoprotein YddW (UPF0748 family)
MDVVKRYDVDGVHIDDYFYPYREARTVTRKVKGQRVRVHIPLALTDERTRNQHRRNDNPTQHLPQETPAMSRQGVAEE